MIGRFGSLAIAGVVALFLIGSSASAESWMAGAAKQKITPGEPMWMAGYGSRNHAATGLLNDLYAKALVLEDGQGTRVALVSLDLVGISPDVAGAICDELQAKYKLPRANVAICCSHTHSGPVVGHNLQTLHYDQVDSAQQQRIDRYASELQRSVVELVGRAIEGLAPSQLSFGTGTAAFAVNRRNNKEPDAASLRAAGKLVGPEDHDVPVLRVADADGKLTAFLFGYACHATVLDGYDWSSDYPGFAQSELEAAHPGATALFFAGCGADQNPLPRRKAELARQYGRELAASVEAVLEQKLEPVTGELQVGWTEIPLELAHVPTREEIEQDAKSADRYVSARGKFYLTKLAAGESLSKTYPYPIQVWRLGEKLTFVALGGEVVVDYALAIKQQLGGERTWVAGYTNDVMAYIPSRRVLAEGGYEGGGAMVYYSLPSPWDPSVEKAILDAVQATVSGLASGAR
jgi:hypothetical protein